MGEYASGMDAAAADGMGGIMVGDNGGLDVVDRLIWGTAVVVGESDGARLDGDVSCCWIEDMDDVGDLKTAWGGNWCDDGGGDGVVATTDPEGDGLLLETTSIGRVFPCTMAAFELSIAATSSSSSSSHWPVVRCVSCLSNCRLVMRRSLISALYLSSFLIASRTTHGKKNK